MSNVAQKHLYIIKFKKNGVSKDYQIPASSEFNAVARLGQIHGDDRNYREDLQLDIIEIVKVR